MTAWGGLEPGRVCSAGELLFVGNHTVDEAGDEHPSVLSRRLDARTSFIARILLEGL